MRKLWPVFVLLAYAVTICHAQDVQTSPSTTTNSTESTDAVKSLLDLRFKLAPVELDISEELTSAKEHYELGEWLAAIDAVTAFLEGNPDHKRTADALFLRGESSVQLQRYDDVLRDFQRLLLSKPNPTQRIRAEFRIAEATMLSQQFANAQRMFEEFRRKYPADALNAYVIAYLAETVGRKNPPWAKALYAESIQQYPNGPLNKRARLHLALIRFNEGNDTVAQSDLERLVETGDASTTEYWTAWYWLARAELRSGQMKSAIDRFLSFTEQDPNHEYTAAALFHVAEDYRKTSEPTRARDLYEKIREDWPDSPYAVAALLGQMQLFKKQGDLQKAFERYEQFDRYAAPRVRLQATQLATEILLSQEHFERAETLIQPYTAAPKSLQDKTERQRYYTSLYLFAMAQRGQGKYSPANELLGRIRMDSVSPDLAQRVLLARIETLVASEDYTQANQDAFRFESAFSNSDLLPAVRAQMVRSFTALKRYDEANLKFQQLRNADDADVSVARAARFLAESAYRRGDLTLARNAFETLEQHQQSDDDLARAASGLAWIDLKQDKTESAAQRFQNFVAAFPNHPSVWSIRMAHAESLTKLKKTDAAIMALEPFETLAAGHALRPRGLYQLADLIQHQLGQAPRARQIVDQLLRDYPDFEQRDAALYLAGMLQRRNDIGQAMQRFTTLAENHPTSKYWSDALYRLAAASHSKRDNDTANRYLTKLITAERDRHVMPHALFMKGRLESDDKNWSQARGTLRELLRKFPDSKLVPVARYGVAESFFQQKEFDRAYQLFQILDREQRFEAGDAWGAMVQLRRAQLEVQRKNLPRATEIAKGIRTDYPDFSLQHEVDYLIGRVAAARGEFSSAREAYQQVVTGDPTYEREITAMAQWMIGESFFHQKRYILAIKAYEALVADLQFENWQAASHLQIGKCYERLDNSGQAANSYARVTKRYGESKWAEEAKHRLESLKGKLGV